MATNDDTCKDAKRERRKIIKARSKAKKAGTKPPPLPPLPSGRRPILLTDEYRTQLAPWRDLSTMSQEEIKAHKRAQNKEAVRRREARKKAARLGVPGPPLLTSPIKDDADRRARAADSERRRRVKLGIEYNRRDRERNNNPERKAKLCASAKAYYENNKEKAILSVKDWTRRNPDKVMEYAKTTRKNLLADPARLAARDAQRRINETRRMREDAAFRILKRLRSSLHQALRLYGDGRKTESTRVLIGCTIEDLVVHIEALWEPWMTWSNYGRSGLRPENGGKAWVIDHLVPCASFDMMNPEEQKVCFHYSNLQPLEYVENIRKGKRLDWQPPVAKKEVA